MQKPRTQPSSGPLLHYVRLLVTQGLMTEGYTVQDVRISCDRPFFQGYWTNVVYVHGQVWRDGMYYDLDGLGEADKMVGKPKWHDARIDIRLHANPYEPMHYQLDAAYLRVSERSKCAR